MAIDKEACGEYGQWMLPGMIGAGRRNRVILKTRAYRPQLYTVAG